MIVKCEQCQTRFKIPDDKVTDKGVKVRCTKCSHTFRVTRDMAQPATSTVPALGSPQATQASAADPFARFGGPAEPPPDAEVTRPGVFALGVEATRRAPAPPYPTKPPPPEAAQPFDFGSLTPPGAASPSSPTVPAVPAYTPPPPAAASPFDFAAIAKPTGAAPASAFDFSNFAAPSQPVAPVPPVRAAAPPPPPPPPPLGGPAAATAPALPAFDFSQMAPPAPSSGAFDMGGLQSQSSAPMSSAAFGGGGSADGFFAGADDAGPAGASTLPVDGAAARAMFDMPAPAAPSLLDLPPEPELVTNARGSTIERVSLSRPAAQVPPAASVAIPAEQPARRRTVVGIIVNVAIAAMLVLGLVVVGSAYVNEGKFTTEALSIEGLRNTFAPSVDFVANDVSNGLYETRAGRSVFFVRGEVMNRSEASVKVVVKAEIVEDGKVVRFGESWAGEPASPEEIFLIENTESLEALNRKVEKRSLVVPPGSAAAFVVPFTEYPPDLKGFRVRVSARAVPVNPTAANP